MPFDFTHADEVRKIADELIREHHTHLITFDVRMEYLFFEKPKKKSGKTTFGYAKKISNLSAYLATPSVTPAATDGVTDESEVGNLDQLTPAEREAMEEALADEAAEDQRTEFFVIGIYLPVWRFALSERQRIALVDHELCHCYAFEDEKTGDTRLTLLAHDLEEFNAVVRRHGVWLEDVDGLLKAAKEGPQFTLDEIAEKIKDSPEDIAARSRRSGEIGDGISSIEISTAGRPPVRMTGSEFERAEEAIFQDARTVLRRQQGGAA